MSFKGALLKPKHYLPTSAAIFDNLVTSHSFRWRCEPVLQGALLQLYGSKMENYFKAHVHHPFDILSFITDILLKYVFFSYLLNPKFPFDKLHRIEASFVYKKQLGSLIKPQFEGLRPIFVL